MVPSMDDFCWACEEASKILTVKPNNVPLKIQDSERLIIVGDLHGCFESIMRIFIGHEEYQKEELGYPG